MSEPIIQITRTEEPDSLEFGTPSKGGAIKVYGNANDPEAFKQKVKNMLEIRKFKDEQIEIQFPQ